MPPHCDAMDGPVVRAAVRALAREQVNEILPYVYEAGEAELARAFEQTLEVRCLGPAAEALADRYFFETAVRLHRAGEGAPFTGLKPAGLDHGPVIPVAERVIEAGSPDELATLLAGIVQAEIHHRFGRMLERQRVAGRSVGDARAYVEAILGLQVYAHQLYQGVKATPHAGGHRHGAEDPAPEPELVEA